MQRLYQDVVRKHFEKRRQMLFLMGPRQVGKTTTSLRIGEEWEESYYFSWENPDHRELILQGAGKMADVLRLKGLRKERPLVIFDEIHRMTGWKDFLKMLFDGYPEKAHYLVTGSGHLDAFRRGGDSLMGRYFSFHVHPLSVAELLHTDRQKGEFLTKPQKLDDEQWQLLYDVGGYPEPFLSGDSLFHRSWQQFRTQQLLREDLRDMTRYHEYDKVELLTHLLQDRVGNTVTYDSLAKALQVANNTVRRWIGCLKALYYCFEVRPWFQNLTRTLVKEPKYYLYDWACLKDPGAKAENFIAQHLLKAVHYWTDSGLGDYQLHFIRDKSKREVDFLIAKDREPWMLIEVKRKLNKGFSSALLHYRKQLPVEHTLQVIVEMDYVAHSCFDGPEPRIVPARTFLSQLV